MKEKEAEAENALKAVSEKQSQLELVEKSSKEGAAVVVEKLKQKVDKEKERRNRLEKIAREVTEKLAATE